MAISADVMKRLIEQGSDSLHLAILNSCRSSDLARSLTDHAPCAIGTTLAIDDSSSLIFSRHFYSAIGQGWSVERAYQAARGS